MDENIRLTMLYDIYGKLLTKKQQEIFEEYYLYNLSLREIATNKSITYQAVRDSIKSSEETLNNFEENVNVLSYKNKLKKIYKLCKEEKDLNLRKEEILNLLSEEDI